jgi:secondary thiamine-phosphate synthase enzyme
MYIELEIPTECRQELHLVSDIIQSAITDSKVKEGICLIYCPHTTAGLTINSYMDPSTAADLQDEIDRLVPTRLNFKHQFDTPSDAAAHIKTSLIGANLSVIIHEGKVLLGHSQGIFLWEYDGPRSRKLLLKIIEG